MSKPWFQHDVDARCDRKCVALILRKGPAGYGIWWGLLEMLRDSQGYRLPLDGQTLGALALQLGTQPETVKEIAELCATPEVGLFETDGKSIWSKSMQRRMERYDEICKRRREAGRKGGEANAKQLLSNCSANAKQLLSKSEANAKPYTRLHPKDVGIGGDGSEKGSQSPHPDQPTEGQQEKKPLKIRAGWKQCPQGHWYNGRYCDDCAIIAKQAELDAERTKKAEAANEIPF